MTTAITAGEQSGAGIGRRSYRDPGSGYLIVVTSPAADPHLWESWIAGATASYRAHDVEHALDLEQIRDGRSTSLLFVALSEEGEVIGGVRSQGPYTDPDQAHAVVEWDGDPAQPAVRAMVAERLPYGVVESKAAWVADDCPGRRELVACLSRVPLHAATLFDARFALGTSAEHTLVLWRRAGAVVAEEVSAAAYPDDRYRTVLIWWDRWSPSPALADSERQAIDEESAQMLAPVVPTQADGR